VALNAKQLRFCQEYVIDCNATQAAHRAGYSPHTAASQGGRLSQHVEVQAEIQRLTREIGKKTEFTAENVLREVWRLASFDPRKLYNDDGSLKSITELDDDTAAAIQGLEVEYLEVGGKVQMLSPEEEFLGEEPVKAPKARITTKKLKWADKNTALTLAMKRFGLLVDKVEATGKDGKDLVPPSDPVETARQIAFLLATAANKGA
jgi:phage terminase small subunit